MNNFELMKTLKIGDEVWFMNDNTPTKGLVISISLDNDNSMRVIIKYGNELARTIASNWTFHYLALTKEELREKVFGIEDENK